MSSTPKTKVCKECREALPLDAFRRHQNYRKPKDLGRSSRCKSCVKARAEKARAKHAAQDDALEAPRYYWDGYVPRCLRCQSKLYFDGQDVACRSCGEQITTARQPVPLVMTKLRLLQEASQATG
jgi:hypothetical protein